MKNLRMWHLTLGSLVSPLLIYFALSGAWQTFRFNDIPKGSEANPPILRGLLHEWSKPHTHATLPGNNPREKSSFAYKVLSLILALAISLTALIGIILGFQMARRRPVVLWSLVIGTLFPLVLLALS